MDRVLATALLVSASGLACALSAPSPALAAGQKNQAFQVSGVIALPGPAPSAIAAPVKAMAQTELEPAPVPDPDIDPPKDVVLRPDLSPALLSAKTEFQGDGFSNASNKDYGQDKRANPAAGLNWSVPVK